MSLDLYGGYTSLPVSGGGTGYFRVAKMGNRWVFVTPLGNAFWMRGVQHATEGFLDASVIPNKYGNDAEVWATERNTRMLGWGFNVLGEATSSRGLPIPNRSSVNGSSVKLPFVLYLTVIQDANLSPFSIGLPDYLKDGLRGVPVSTYNGYRASFIADVYSPLYGQAVQGEYDFWKNAIPSFPTTPWIIGITPDDADGLWGFKGPSGNVFQPYPNPAWLLAMTKFTYTSAERPGGGNWVDPKFYTKYAWRDFLVARYSTIGALNTAWGTSSFYTTFDDSGGFGTGTGVLDEDGRHTGWVGTMSMVDYSISGANATFLQDVNDFLYQYAKTYASTAVTSIRNKGDLHHMIFGPDAINNYGEQARSQIVQGLKDGGLNVLIQNYDPRDAFKTMAGNNATYDVSGLPCYIWYSLLANADSDWSGHTPYAGAPDFATQVIRAQHYASDLQAFLSARGSNGDYYVIGLDWWQLVDTQSASESANDGLTSHLDNAYDGVQAIIAASTDAQGYARGGEAANYGNFLGGVTTANASIEASLTSTPTSRQRAGVYA